MKESGIAVRYIQDDGKWLDGPDVKNGDEIVHTVRKSWSDIWWYYPNVIDYFRCLMVIAALILIIIWPQYEYWIAALIMGNVLLDWVDGPVARSYG